ncbi:MAG: polyprenyl synthetase family protein [Acidaminobacteraceae bacterium]
MTFKVKLTKIQELINNKLEDLFNYPANIYQEKLFDSMKYSLNSGGKRLRPILLIETAKLFGDIDSEVYTAAIAVEMIHTYSLIHDDLPCMDNDDLRRGNPTNHIVYGVDTALLSGDGLLNSSYELISKAALNSNRPINVLKALSHLSMRAGVDGMIVGQVADIESDKSDDNTALTLEYINLNKTGALIEASMVCGALINGASDEDIEKISKIAFNLGLCFQLIDDILDIEGDEETLGKPVGSDEKNKKKTYPNIIGISEVKKLAFDLTIESKKLLNHIDGDTKFLDELFDYLLTRKY